ncbi:MAG: hypothetical protein R2729_10675 [Bryobacteraceae bacterium]
MPVKKAAQTNARVLMKVDKNSGVPSILDGATPLLTGHLDSAVSLFLTNRKKRTKIEVGRDKKGNLILSVEDQ